MSDYLNAAQAAKELNWSGQYVRRLLEQGVIKGQKVGPNWVITREDLEKYKADKEAVEDKK